MLEDRVEEIVEGGHRERDRHVNRQSDSKTGRPIGREREEGLTED